MQSRNTILCNAPEELSLVVEQLFSTYPTARIFALYGGMGVGKTTFVKAIGSYLGVQQVVSSPTFSIVNVYYTNQAKEVYHFDFYRIKHIQEVYDIGYEEYFFSGNYCFLEWPELIEELIPEDTVKITITENTTDNSRVFSF